MHAMIAEPRTARTRRTTRICDPDPCGPSRPCDPWLCLTLLRTQTHNPATFQPATPGEPHATWSTAYQEPGRDPAGRRAPGDDAEPDARGDRHHHVGNRRHHRR